MKSLFINLSNHPSDRWDDKQLAAAREIGEILDIPFPQINPEANTESVEDLAISYLEEILDIADEYDAVTVHLMGEMVFTFSLCTLLLARQIRVVASTTRRCVEEHSDGSRTVHFAFISFRDYKMPQL